MPEILRFPHSKAPVRPVAYKIDDQTLALLKILLLAVLAIGFFIFHVWFRTYALTSGFDVALKRRDLSRLESEIIELRLKKNHTMGPQSLQKLTDTYRQQGIIFEAPKAQQVYYSRDSE